MKKHFYGIFCVLASLSLPASDTNQPRLDGALAASIARTVPGRAAQTILSASIRDAVVLAPISDLELDAVNQHNAVEGSRRFQIGMARSLSRRMQVNQREAPASQWTTHSSGWRAYSVSVASPGATGLRIHLENVTLPPGARLVVYDQKNPGAASVISAESLKGEKEIWTPTIFAEQAAVEIQVPPGKNVEAATLEIGEVSHLYDVPQSSWLKLGTCHKDVTCYPAWAQEASGVARISFVQGGNVYMCTGCLLGTSNGDSTDYFLTANHCIPNQTTASTMELYWFYQTSSCNGTAPDLTTVPHTTGGAEMLATSTANDFAFLKLRQAAPGGTAHLGWSTVAPTTGDNLVGIHHPDGSYKRICFGKYYDSDANFWAVQWYSGVTEPGSSGSPLLNSSHLVIGQLNGGFAGPGSSCSSPTSPDQYGRFDVTYPKIAHWVGSDGSGGGGGGGFVPTAGVYNGLFSDSNSDPLTSSGFITISVTSKGKFSGKLQAGTRHASFKGSLDGSGAASVNASAGPFGSWTVALQVDAANADHISGTIDASTFSAAFDAYRAVSGKGNISAQAGQYTLVIPGTPGSSDQPGGDSFGTVTISSAGKLKLSGSLSDGTKISQSVGISTDGKWPLYVSLYGGAGSLSGWITVSGGLSGTVSWDKPATTKSKAYNSGFELSGSLSGSTYTKPSFGGTLLSGDTLHLNISGSDLGSTISDDIQVLPNGKVINLSSDRLTLSFSTSSGAFKGSVISSDTGRALPFSGVVLQDQGTAVGYFLSDGSSGEVSIAP
jgi:hypothetical protein